MLEGGSVAVGVEVDMGVSVAVLVGVGVSVAVDVGVSLAVGVEVEVGVSVGGACPAKSHAVCGAKSPTEGSGERSRRISISTLEWKRLLRFARNDTYSLYVILRSAATKNLVHGKQHPPVQRTRCFTSFSMTSSCIMSLV